MYTVFQMWTGCGGGGIPHHTTPGPLLPAALLGKYSTLGRDWILRRCHREHLVMVFQARTPAEFTELSVSPVTCPCLCASLLEPLDMLNTPTYGWDQVFYMLQRCQKMGTCIALIWKCLLMETPSLLLFQVRSCCTLSEAVCCCQHGWFQRHRPLSVWITAVYICIMPVIMG